VEYRRVKKLDCMVHDQEEHAPCDASSRASARGKPIMTPPSAIASRNMHAKAGPDPDNAVHASKCFSSRNRHRPIEEKICDTICLGSEGGRLETTVIPSRIYSIRNPFVNTLAGWLAGWLGPPWSLGDRQKRRDARGMLRLASHGPPLCWAEPTRRVARW
jgi:hypothetical protein